MKTVLVPILCFSLLIATSQSKKIEPGIKLGYGRSSVSPKSFQDYAGQTQNYSDRGTFIGGLKVLFPLTKTFGLLPEIEILGKGANVTNYYYNLNTYYQVNLNGYYRSKGNEGGYLFGAGPFLGIAGASDWQGKSKNDVGINLLAGYQVPIGFSFELHYMQSFTDQVENNYYGDNQAIRYSNWGFTVGYFF